MDESTSLLEVARDSEKSYEERLVLLERALSGGAVLPPEVLALRGDMLRFVGRIDESEGAFRELEKWASSDARFLAVAKVGLANVRCTRAEWAAARAILDEVLVSHESAVDRPFVARVHAIRASTFFNEQRLSEAQDALERALEIQRALRDREGEAISTTSLGIVAFAEGESSRAFSLLDEGRALAKRIGLTHWEAMAKSYLAMLRHEAGDLDAASRLYEESIGDLDALGVRRAGGITLFGRAILHFERRAFDRADEDFRDALSAERATSPDYEPLLVATLSLPAAVRRDAEARDHQLRFARECAGRRGDRFVFIVDALDRALVGGAPFDELRDGKTIEGRLVARALDALARAGTSHELRIAADASRFSLDGASPVDIARRKPLKRILEALAARHAAGPNRPLSVETLVRAGWPDDRLIGSTGATRLYTAIATLRKMGLEDVIERRGEGYALSESCVVRIDS